MKPGYRTSEFWLALLVSLANAAGFTVPAWIGHAVPLSTSAPVAGVSAAIVSVYTLARSLVKTLGPPPGSGHAVSGPVAPSGSRVVGA